jgi:glycosyltransferase involved in cell wall biosynthesis
LQTHGDSRLLLKILSENGRNGILVELDPRSIVDAILGLYSNKDLLECISGNNLRDSVKFDWPIVADRYLRLFAELA